MKNWSMEVVNEHTHDLLVGVLLVQTGTLAPQQLATAAVNWTREPVATSLIDWLRKQDVISEKSARFLDDLVKEVLRLVEGDCDLAIEHLGGEAQITRAFLGVFNSRGEAAQTLARGGSAATNFRDPASIPCVHENPGRYTMEAEYARGGMGRILIVHDEHLQREVAMKVLLDEESAFDTSEQSHMASLLARFVREAQVTGRLEHPAIVPVHELGRRTDGSIYYTMKFVRGRNMADAIKQAGDIKQRLELIPHFLDLCNAIAFAHSKGVLHRDIKPTNVLIGSFGETVVIDWGLAKTIEQVEDTLSGIGKPQRDGDTMYGAAIGTPAYMAPEQARGELDKIDERSDIFALGVVLYEILTGTNPFNVISKGQRFRRERPLVDESLEPGKPRELLSISLRAMGELPDERYRSVQELSEDVRRFLSGALVQAYDYSLQEHLRRFVYQYRRAFSFVALLLVAALAFGYYSYTNVRTAHQQTSAALHTSNENLYQASIHLAERRLNEGQADAAMQSLADAPPDWRHWEWGHLLLRSAPHFTHAFPSASTTPGEDAPTLRKIQQFRGHTTEISSVDFHAASDRLLSGGGEGSLFVWTPTRSEPLAKLKIDGEIIHAVAVSKNGEYVAGGTWRGAVYVWEIDTGRLRARLQADEAGIRSVAFTSDGQKIWAGAVDGELAVWNIASGQLEAKFQAHDAALVDLTFGHDESRLVTAGLDGAVKVWTAEGGEVDVHHAPSTSGVTVVAISPTLEYVFTGYTGGRGVIWRRATGETIATIPDCRASVDFVGFSPDEEWLALPSTEYGASVWRVSTGERIATLGDPGSQIRGARFCGDDTQLLLADSNGRLSLWGRLPSDRQGVMSTVLLHSDTVYQATFLADGQVATGAYDGHFRTWDPATGKLTGSVALSSEIAAIFVSPDRRRLIAGTFIDESILLDRNGQPIKKFSEPKTDMARAFGGPQSEIMLGSAALFPKIFSPNSRYFADYGISDLVIRSAADATAVKEFTVKGAIASVAWIDMGKRILVGTSAGYIECWNLATGQLAYRQKAHDGWIVQARQAPNREIFLTTSLDGTLKVWNPRTGALLAAFEDFRAAPFTIRFSPNGDLAIISTLDGSLMLFDLDRLQPRWRVVGHTAPCLTAEFHPNGDRILSAGKDNQIRIWDLRGKEVLALEHPGLVYAEWSPDGQQLLSAGRDRTARVWHTLHADQLLPFSDGASLTDALFSWVNAQRN